MAENSSSSKESTHQVTDEKRKKRSLILTPLSYTGGFFAGPACIGAIYAAQVFHSPPAATYSLAAVAEIGFLVFAADLFIQGVLPNSKDDDHEKKIKKEEALELLGTFALALIATALISTALCAIKASGHACHVN